MPGLKLNHVCNKAPDICIMPDDVHALNIGKSLHGIINCSRSTCSFILWQLIFSFKMFYLKSLAKIKGIFNIIDNNSACKG